MRNFRVKVTVDPVHATLLGYNSVMVSADSFDVVDGHLIFSTTDARVAAFKEWSNVTEISPEEAAAAQQPPQPQTDLSKVFKQLSELGQLVGGINKKE